VGFDDGASQWFVLAFVDEIEVAHQRNLRGSWDRCGEGLGLSAGFVETALWEHSRDLLAAAEYVDDRPLVGVVGIVVLREGLADQV